jgi:hypothetical protein
MMSVLGWILDLVGLGILTLMAYGGFGLSVLAWAIRFHPQVRWPATELAILVFGAACALSAWSFSALHHDRTTDLDQLRKENRRWAEAVAEQARQRAEMEAIALKQQQLAALRLRVAAKLQETVDDYAAAQLSGAAGACPADEPYSRAMRSIPVGRPGTGAAPGAASGSDSPMPKPRPQR